MANPSNYIRILAPNRASAAAEFIGVGEYPDITKWYAVKSNEQKTSYWLEETTVSPEKARLARWKKFDGRYDENDQSNPLLEVLREQRLPARLADYIIKRPALGIAPQDRLDALAAENQKRLEALEAMEQERARLSQEAALAKTHATNERTRAHTPGKDFSVANPEDSARGVKRFFGAVEPEVKSAASMVTLFAGAMWARDNVFKENKTFRFFADAAILLSGLGLVLQASSLIQKGVPIVRDVLAATAKEATKVANMGGDVGIVVASSAQDVAGNVLESVKGAVDSTKHIVSGALGQNGSSTVKGTS
jgi:hypothetical protein